MSKGWYGNRYEHSLASKGIRSKGFDVKLDKVILYHGTSPEIYNYIKEAGYLEKPYLATEEEIDEWTDGLILEIEIPKDFINKNCRIDEFLLVENYFMPTPFDWYERKFVGGLDKEHREMYNNSDKDTFWEEYWNQNPDDAREYIEEVIERKGLDAFEWCSKYVGAFKSEENIPVEWIKGLEYTENKVSNRVFGR